VGYQFDGANRLIVLTLGTTAFAASDLYSKWKEWVAAGNASFPPAFRTVGGDPLGGGVAAGDYYFLNNVDGWRIRPQEANHELVVSGNLFGEDANLPVFTPTLGSFNVLIQRSVSQLTQTVATGGGGGASPSQVADAVRAELENGAPLPVNVKQINNRQLKGTGVPSDPWGPVP
jgi:hypothetical protein